MQFNISLFWQIAFMVFTFQCLTIRHVFYFIFRCINCVLNFVNKPAILVLRIFCFNMLITVWSVSNYLLYLFSQNPEQ